MVQALLLPADGSPTRTVEWGGWDLVELDRLIGCSSVIPMPLADPRFCVIMWVDEDGGLRADKPTNHGASALFRAESPAMATFAVVGDVVITGRFLNQRLLPVSDEAVELIRIHLGVE